MEKADRVILILYFILDIAFVRANWEGLGSGGLSEIWGWATIAILARMLFLLRKRRVHRSHPRYE